MFIQCFEWTFYWSTFCDGFFSGDQMNEQSFQWKWKWKCVRVTVVSLVVQHSTSAFAIISVLWMCNYTYSTSVCNRSMVCTLYSSAVRFSSALRCCCHHHHHHHHRDFKEWERTRAQMCIKWRQLGEWMRIRNGVVWKMHFCHLICITSHWHATINIQNQWSVVNSTTTIITDRYYSKMCVACGDTTYTSPVHVIIATINPLFDLKRQPQNLMVANEIIHVDESFTLYLVWFMWYQVQLALHRFLNTHSAKCHYLAWTNGWHEVVMWYATK